MTLPFSVPQFLIIFCILHLLWNAQLADAREGSVITLLCLLSPLFLLKKALLAEGNRS